MPESININVDDELLVLVKRNELDNATKLLYENNIKINKKNLSRCLQFAAQNNNPTMLALLFKYKAKPAMVTYEGVDITLMQYASAIKAWDCIIVITKFYKAGVQDYGKYGEVLLLEVENSNYTVVEALVQAGAPLTIQKNSRTCMEIAISRNDVKMLWLLEYKRLPEFCSNTQTHSLRLHKKTPTTSPILQSYVRAHSPIPGKNERRGSIYSFFVPQSSSPEIDPLPMPKWYLD
jgi:hypothetical protein